MTAPAPKPLFSSNHHFDILICLGLVLAIVVPYHQVAGHRFIEFDDGLYTYYNTQIMRGLSWDSICWAFTNTEAANWHPLTWISLLVDRELFGPYPGGYLLENVAWHALASCLCYLAFFRTTKSRLFAFTVALILAVHPANVENVAWMSERKSLLNAVLWFCAIITYLDFIETRSWRAYGFTVIAHSLGLMCKSMSVTLPGTLVLIHVLWCVYQPDRGGLPSSFRLFVKKIIAPVLPLAALSIYFAAVTISAQSVAIAGVAEFSLPGRLINTVLSYERYVFMFFHPTALAIFYPLLLSELTWGGVVVPALVLAAITVAVLMLVRRKPQLLLGWCWFLGTMLPVIGLVQVGSQSYADRYLYMPMVGLALVFPALFEELRAISRPLWRGIIATSLAAIGISLILATQIQVSYWRNGVTLFQHSLEVSGNCVTNVFTLAIAYHRAERYRDVVAFTDTEIAIATNPINVAKLYAIKASALYNLKEHTAAIASAQKALDLGNTDASTYMILAGANYDLGHFDKAAKSIAKARAALKTTYGSDYISQYLQALVGQLERKINTNSSVEAARPAPPRAQRSQVLGTK